MTPSKPNNEVSKKEVNKSDTNTRANQIDGDELVEKNIIFGVFHVEAKKMTLKRRNNEHTEAGRKVKSYKFSLNIN